MGGKGSRQTHVTHVHHPPPPSLAERRENVNAKLEQTKTMNAAIVGELNAQAQQLRTIQDDHDRRANERARQLEQLRSQQASEIETRRASMLAQALAERARLQRELANAEAETQEMERVVLQDEADQRDKELRKEQEAKSLKEMSTAKSAELDVALRQLEEVSQSLSKSNSDALGSDAITTTHREALINLQFMLASLPRHGLQSKQKLESAALSLKALLDRTLHPFLVALDQSLQMPTFVSDCTAILSMPEATGLTDATRAAITNRGLNGDRLKRTLADPKRRDGTFSPESLQVNGFDLEDLVTAVDANTDELLTQTGLALAEYASAVSVATSWRAKAKDATHQLTKDAQQFRQAALTN